MSSQLDSFDVEDVPAGAVKATLKFRTEKHARLRMYRYEGDEAPVLLHGPSRAVKIDLSLGTRLYFQRLDQCDWEISQVGFSFPLKTAIETWFAARYRGMRRSGVVMPAFGFLTGIAATSLYWQYKHAPTSDELKIIYDVAPMIAVLMSIVTLILSMRHNRFAMGVNLLDKLNADFHSETMRSTRSRAASALLQTDIETDPSVDTILNFFEHVALLERRGAIDRELLWHSFYYWFNHYFRLTVAYRTKMRKDDPTQWEDMERLFRQTSEQQRRHSTKAATDSCLIPSAAPTASQISFIQEERSLAPLDHRIQQRRRNRERGRRLRD